MAFRDYLRRVLAEANEFPKRAKEIERGLAYNSERIDRILQFLQSPPPGQYELLLLWLDKDGWPRMQSFTGPKVDAEHTRGFQLDYPVPAGAWLVARNCEFRGVRIGNFNVNDGNGSTLAILPEWKLGSVLHVAFK